MANDIARVPLEQRLGSARDGSISAVLAGRILTELALLPISGVCAARPGSADRLERMTENAVMDRINPAVTGEWGLERTCYASVAWYTETAFRALEATGNPDSRRILARVTEKATKSLADAFGHLATELTRHDIVDPYLHDHLPDCVTSLVEWVGCHGSDMALKALRWRERGLGEKCLLAGFLCLPIESLGNAAGQLIASSPKAGPSAPDRLASLMGRLLERGPRERWVMTYLCAALDGDRRARLADVLRPILVAPFAAIWESGALLEVAEPTMARSSRCPELDRRLRSER